MIFDFLLALGARCFRFGESTAAVDLDSNVESGFSGTPAPHSGDVHSSVPEFDRLRYKLPFGRYEGNRRAEYPANEVLVGREKERARLLDHLFNTGRRGAFLITGHRGSGKTTFVRHCLESYRADVYNRYLQRNVGRAMFWDRIGLVLLGLVLVGTGLILSQIAYFAARDPHPRFPAIALSLFLLTILAAPLALAGRVLQKTISRPYMPIESDAPRKRWISRCRRRLDVHRPPIAGPLALGALLVYALIANSGPPAVYLSQHFTAFSLTLLIAAIWSTLPSSTPSEGQDRSVEIERRATEAEPPLMPILVLGALVFLSLPLWPGREGSQIVGYVAFYWAAGVMALSGYCLLRYCQTNSVVRRVFSAYPTVTSAPPEHIASSSASRWYLFGALLGACGSLLLTRASLSHGLRAGHAEAVWLGFVVETILLSLLVLSVKWRRKVKGNGCGQARKPVLKFYPRPRLVLGLKALTFILVAVALMAPASAELLRMLFGEGVEGLSFAGAPSALWGLSSGFGRIQDFAFILGTLALVALFAAFEYEWVVRPYAEMRDDYSLQRRQPDPDRDRQNLSFSHSHRGAQILAEQTLFWHLYKAWLPVVVVPVNLGFDLLDQRLVIEAMLSGLKLEYRKRFVQWSAPLPLVRRGLGLLTSWVIALYIGAHHFHVATDDQLARLISYTLCDAQQPGLEELDATRTPPEPLPIGLWLGCRLGGEGAVQALTWSPLLDHRQIARLHSGSSLRRRPGSLGETVLGIGPGGRAHPLEIHVYDLLLFVIVFLIGGRIASVMGVSPYRRLDREMGRILDGLSSRLREESRTPTFSMWRWVSAFTGKELVYQKEAGPSDPRIIEIAFLRILNEIQEPSTFLLFPFLGRVNLPFPEVCFVFDELDKIGISSTSSQEPTSSQPLAAEPLDEERERSRALHKLFADLKNTVSAGQARFLFIGGRNLHDEWLADQTARRPLLTQIFGLEIYIPSLLIDDRNPGALELPAIQGYLARQLFRANECHRASLLKRLRPWLAIWAEELEMPSFVQHPSRFSLQPLGESSSPVTKFDLALEVGLWPDLIYSKELPGQDVFNRELPRFFAYRSKGNVKRLRELLETFVQPAGSTDVTQTPGNRVDHFLVFEDVDRFRVQAITTLYLRLAPVLDVPIRAGDDKMPQAILHLSDFLLKFHRRAFSWSNIERVDELVHIHRAPDLRRSLMEILLRWENLFLHRIRNGMYDFRFASEFARELDYMSRSSEQEMAALNFTLDESQVLKSIYRARIEALGEEMAGEFIGGLAELHKFDEEYELARAYSRRAIDLLDRRFRQDMRRMFGANALEEVFTGQPHGRMAARLRIGWGVTRLRLMLQMAMSFERARDFEHAQVEYREARTLSNVLIRALVAWVDAEFPDEPYSEGLGPLYGALHFESRVGDDGPGAGEYLFNLKHLPLLFQSLFAEAWLAEKSGVGADTAPAMIETGLWRLRQWLPFVGPDEFSSAQSSNGPLNVRHSSFSLLTSELHNKAGDLYFYKGRQLVPEALSRAWSEDPELKPQSTDGYLLRADYHYCLSIHDVRRFASLRKTVSGMRFGLAAEDMQPPTIVEEGWPEVAISSLAGSLADLADTLFARISYTRLMVWLCRLKGAPNVPVTNEGTPPDATLRSVQHSVGEAYQAVVQWTEAGSEDLLEEQGVLHSSDETWRMAVGRFVLSVAPGDSTLSRWLGRPAPTRLCREGTLLVQKHLNPDSERLVASVLLGFVAARMLERAGNSEASIQQLLRVAMQVETQMAWVFTFNHVFTVTMREIETWKYARRNGTLGIAALSRCRDLGMEHLAIAVVGLEKVRELCRQRVETGWGGGSSRSLSDPRVNPPELLTLSCSLALHSMRLEAPAGRLAQPDRLAIEKRYEEAVSRLHQMIRELTGQVTRSGAAGKREARLTRQEIRRILSESLRVHAYPVLNRLRGLKVLLDDAVLGEVGAPGLTDLEAARGLYKWLRRFQDEYSEDLTFTPLQVGTSLALLWITDREMRQTEQGSLLFSQALEQLHRSQGMYTLRRPYYDSIAELYYLYDDFNDRAVHFAHAVQMAGAELSGFLVRTLMELRRRVDPAEIPRARPDSYAPPQVAGGAASG